MKNENLETRPAALRSRAPEKPPRQTFITISPDGEIAAWGLDPDVEKLILRLTGNRELIKANRKMAYELCG